MSTLYVRDGDAFSEAAAPLVLRCANNIIAQRYRAGSPVLDDPHRTREFLTLKLGALEHEVFGMLLLDNRHALIAYHELFRGTINGTSVHPREVVKSALAGNAAAVILVHNHPSGNIEPSTADKLITARLREALALVEIRVLDHMIVAGTSILSFAEHGIL